MPVLQRHVCLLIIDKRGCDDDDRYAEPEHEMEDEVEDGELVGSMYGVLDSKKGDHKVDSAKPSKLEKALTKVTKVIEEQLENGERSSAAEAAVTEAAQALQRIGAALSGLQMPATIEASA